MSAYADVGSPYMQTSVSLLGRKSFVTFGAPYARVNPMASVVRNWVQCTCMNSHSHILYTDLIKSVCSDLLSDKSFHLQTAGNNICLKLAQELLDIIDHSRQDSESSEFLSWLHLQLLGILQSCKTNKDGLTDRDKLWTDFHKLRSETSFFTKWEQFLDKNRMQKEPHVLSKCDNKAI